MKHNVVVVPQVAVDCGMIPLAADIAGRYMKQEALHAACWQSVHEDIKNRRAVKFHGTVNIERRTIFAAIDIGYDALPSEQQEQLRLLAVMASGVPATWDMVANLWNKVRVACSF